MNKNPKFVHTISGKQIDPESPQAADIDIQDIALGLSKVCRYSGQQKKFISVAEHCVWVSQQVPPTIALHALLHDAAEAYMGDVPSPIKHLCHDFTMIETRFDQAVLSKFNLKKLSPKCKEELKYWDKQSCIEEMCGHMQFLEHDKAYKLFIKRYRELTK